MGVGGVLPKAEKKIVSDGTISTFRLAHISGIYHSHQQLES